MYPGTDAGYVVGALAAVTGVLIMNVPIAFILISFDEVYSTRKEREHSVSATHRCPHCVVCIAASLPAVLLRVRACEQLVTCSLSSLSRKPRLPDTCHCCFLSVQMNQVVDKIFSWMDRNRAETEAMREEALKWQVMQTIEAAKKKGKYTSVRKLMTLVRQKRKREQWQKKKVVAAQKAKLLEALMDPYCRDELLDSSTAANKDLEEAQKTRKYRRFFLRWKHNALDDHEYPGTNAARFSAHTEELQSVVAQAVAKADRESIVRNQPARRPIPVIRATSEV
jgi:hypothetical protein